VPGSATPDSVRASCQQAAIAAAVGRVVAADQSGLLAAGTFPEVRTCADFNDAKGHLTGEAAAALGRVIGLRYAAGAW
jgi:hypothetical protein